MLLFSFSFDRDVLKYMQDGGCGNVGTSKPKPKQAAGKIVTTTTAESHEKDPKPKEVKSGKPSKVVATVTTKYTDNPVDTMRATIAKRLTKSKVHKSVIIRFSRLAPALCNAIYCQI